MAGQRRDANTAGITGSVAEGWKIRVTALVEGRRVQRKASLPAGTSYQRAVQARDRLREGIEVPSLQLPARAPTVEQHCVAWLGLRAQEVQSRTADAYAAALARIPDWLAARRIDQISRSDLERFRLEIPRQISELGTPYKATTQQRTWAVVRACLKAAWEEWRIPDPGATLRGPKGPEEPAGRALPMAEAQAVLTQAQQHSPLMGCLTLLALTTGLRVGELSRLWREHLHLDELTPHLVVAKSKTKAGRRALPLTPEACEALRLHLGLEPESPWVFCARSKWGSPLPRGGPLGEGYLRRHLRKIAAHLGLEPINPHDLRRTYLSLLWQAGTDEVTRMLLAGHVDAATARRYVRPSLQELADKSGAALRLVSGGCDPKM